MSSSEVTKAERIEQLHTSQPGQTALLVIDMQCGFLDPAASLFVPEGRRIIPRIAQLIACCRDAFVPVIYTEFVYATPIPCLRGDPFGPEHLPADEDAATGYGHPSSNCLIGSRAGQGAESAVTIDELAPCEDELVIVAHTYDKFYGTPLDLALRSRGIDRLIVTGVTTDVCVNSTVLAAANRNYRVTVVSDAVATLDDTIQQSCLKIWENKFARIRTTEQMLQELRIT